MGVCHGQLPWLEVLACDAGLAAIAALPVELEPLVADEDPDVACVVLLAVVAGIAACRPLSPAALIASPPTIAAIAAALAAPTARRAGRAGCGRRRRLGAGLVSIGRPPRSIASAGGTEAMPNVPMRT
jgi:hypothetical protein